MEKFYYDGCIEYKKQLDLKKNNDLFNIEKYAKTSNKNKLILNIIKTYNIKVSRLNEMLF